MKRLSKYMVAVMILLLAVVLMTGCCIDDKVTGGGWFMATVGRDETKCTFGFNAQGEGCICDPIVYKGQFQFNDHAGTKLHCLVMDLEQIGPNLYEFRGVDKKSEEDIVVTVADLGQPGADPGDGIMVKCDGQVWRGSLGGGNIVIH